MTMGRWLPPFGISFTADVMGATFALASAVLAFIVLVYAAGRPAEANGGSFHALTTVRTDARGYFAKSAANASGREWRLVWQAPDGTTFRGTPTRAYAG